MKANWFLSDDAPQFQRVFVLICVNMLKGYNMDIYYIYIYIYLHMCVILLILLIYVYTRNQYIYSYVFIYCRWSSDSSDRIFGLCLELVASCWSDDVVLRMLQWFVTSGSLPSGKLT